MNITRKSIPALSAAILALGAGGAWAQSSNSAAILHTQQIPAGTDVKLTLQRGLNSGTARVGETVRAITAQDDHSGLPQGTVFIGRVTQVRPATAKYAGAMTVSFGLPQERGSVSSDTYGSNNPNTYGGNANGRDYRDTNNGQYNNNSQYNNNDQYNSRPRMAFSDAASAHLTGQAARSDKSNYTTIGAGAGAVLGLARKGKIGDALEGALLGGAGGYAANAVQKRAGGDVSIDKGAELTAHLDAPLVLRTEIVAPY